MAKKKTKDLKDLSTWEEGLGKIASSKGGGSSPKGGGVDKGQESKGETGDKVVTGKDDTKQQEIPVKEEALPSPEEIEKEWEKKIEEPDTDVKKRAQSIDDVAKLLKSSVSESGEKETAGAKGRLGKIEEVVEGKKPEITERELMGKEIPGLYRIYPLGSYPPLNLLSKMLLTVSKSSLEFDLETSGIPLYQKEYASFSSAISFVFSLLLSFVLFLLTMNIVLFAISFVSLLLLFSLFAINWPSMQVSGGAREIDRQLPFALRHMSALLTAGISIFDSLISVSRADYGALSKELDRVVWDVKSGKNLSDALDDAARRTGSKAFMRVTIHIRRALEMGGDVAKIINQIAEDLTFEMRMKISDFVEKLNAFAIVYIVAGIVGPVVIAVFSLVGTIQMQGTVALGGGMNTFMLGLMLLLVFPMVMIVITYVVKLLEPKV